MFVNEEALADYTGDSVLFLDRDDDLFLRVQENNNNDNKLILVLLTSLRDRVGKLSVGDIDVRFPVREAPAGAYATFGVSIKDLTIEIVQDDDDDGDIPNLPAFDAAVRGSGNMMYADTQGGLFMAVYTSRKYTPAAVWHDNISAPNGTAVHNSPF